MSLKKKEWRRRSKANIVVNTQKGNKVMIRGSCEKTDKQNRQHILKTGIDQDHRSCLRNISWWKCKITDENAAVQNYTFSHMEQEVVVKDANEHDNKNDITALTQRRCGKKTKTISKL